MIEFYIVASVAGILTVLAPCILPLLPVIIGGSSLHQNESSKTTSLRKPLTIIISLIISIITFTLLLKASTTLLGVPSTVWSAISSGIIIVFGITVVFPSLWEKFMLATRLNILTARLMGGSHGKTGIGKDILLGASLGPIFNSCSPTYILIVAVILPASFATGFSYLIAYSIGLGSILLLISIFGRSLVRKLRWMSDPRGVFQKVIGVTFIAVGIFVLFGLEKQGQTFVLESGWYDPVAQLEESLRR